MIYHNLKLLPTSVMFQMDWLVVWSGPGSGSGSQSGLRVPWILPKRSCEGSSPAPFTSSLAIFNKSIQLKTGFSNITIVIFCTRTSRAGNPIWKGRSCWNSPCLVPLGLQTCQDSQGSNHKGFLRLQIMPEANELYQVTASSDQSGAMQGLFKKWCQNLCLLLHGFQFFLSGAVITWFS